MLKGRGDKHEPKGNLGSLHTIPIFRQSLPIKPAYRVLLVCTCASGRMYTSDNCREKKRCFLNDGNSLNMINKGLGNKTKQKKSLTAQMKKYFDREKGLVYNCKLNFEEKKWRKNREKAKAMPLLL